MAVYKRPDLDRLMEQAAGGELFPIYLFTGERSLCLEAVDGLVSRLFVTEKEREQGLRRISGEQEDLKEVMGFLRTFSMFSPRTVVLVDDTRLFKSKKVADRVWERAVAAHVAGDKNRARGAILNFLAIGRVKPEDFDTLSEAQWQDSFGFARPDKVLIEEMALTVAGTALPREGGGGEEALAEWVEAGGPGGNILILITAEVDRRKSLYKLLSKKAAVVDLKVDQGTSKAARESRAGILQDVLRRSLAAVNKRLAPGAEKVLLERVGFHPEALRLEIEKLAMFAPDDPEISLETVRNEVPLTSEHAIFELTEAFFAGRLSETIVLLERLLENGMHGLAVIAGLRNQARKLLAARELAAGPVARRAGFSPGMSFPAFQKGCLAAIKEAGLAPEITKGHPFVVYKLLSQAAKIAQSRLIRTMEALMACEMGLKGSGIPDRTLLFAMIFHALTPER